MCIVHVQGPGMCIILFSVCISILVVVGCTTVLGTCGLGICCWSRQSYSSCFAMERVFSLGHSLPQNKAGKQSKRDIDSLIISSPTQSEKRPEFVGFVCREGQAKTFICHIFKAASLAMVSVCMCFNSLCA